ncbi:hypothetical protein [Saccharothrix hoggarensis]|uniref:Ig-like domain-containing protein n=1 Tax=Saccharothrix hoggarensis TaxID=913853 RepID=A0ABW3QYA3_9PSEU
MVWRERLVLAVAALVAAVLVAGFLTVLLAPGVRPRLTHVAGDAPEDRPSYECSALREPGVPCERERDYRWSVPAGGSVSTTWSTSLRDTDRVGGVLALARDDCPDARVSWTLTATGHTSAGVLPAERPAVPLRTGLSGDQDRITVEFRRTDTASCPAVVTWTYVTADAPWFGFVWSWW